MAYNTKYKIEFNSFKGNDYVLDILEDGFSGTVLNFDGISWSLDWLDGDKSKIPTVRRSQLQFVVNTTTPDIFIAEKATSYKVHLYVNGVLNWVGWLDSGSIQYNLQDGFLPLGLTAKDGLHLLEEEEFTDLSGNKPFIFYRISDLIAFCLNKTQLGLNFYNWISIYPDGASVRDAVADPTGTRDPFYISFVSARTFQTGEGEYDSPFIILQKICSSFKMSLFQARGNWHLVYTEDLIKNDGLSCTIFNSSGVPQSILLNQRFRIETGLHKEYKLKDFNTLVTVEDAVKKVKLNYNFATPFSLIRNADLNEGSFLAFQNGGFRAEYSLDGFTQSGSAGATDAAVIATDLFIANDASTERFRYIRFGSQSSGEQYREIVTTANPINESDYFTFSFNYRPRPTGFTNVNLYLDIVITQTSFPFAVRYLGADGKWKSTRQFINIGDFSLPGSVVEEDNEKSYEIITQERMPFTGSMQVYFRYRTNRPVSVAFGPWIWDIRLNYQPTIASGRKVADGHVYESSTSEISKSIYEEEVYISDALNIVVAGAITNSNSVLIQNWFHEGVTESVRLGKIICRALWKIFYRNYYQLEGACSKCVDSNNYIISPLNTLLPDAFDGKEFFVSTLKVDLKDDKFDFTAVELLNYNTTDDFDEIADTENYKFINIGLDDRFRVDRIFRRPPYSRYGVLGSLLWVILGNKSKKS